LKNVARMVICKARGAQRPRQQAMKWLVAAKTYLQVTS
jgi:hypothetical protein